MKITVGTNVPLRAVVADDAEQAAVARALLLQTSVVAVRVPVFCELAWVLKRTYARNDTEIAAAIEALNNIDVIATDLPAVEASMVALHAGVDFADSVISHQGKALGGTVFASFYRRAVARLRDTGVAASDPSELAV